VRSATSNDERENRKLVDFVVRKLVELSGGHDHRVDCLLREKVDVARDDSDLKSDGLGGGGVVSGEHTDGNAGAYERKIVSVDRKKEGKGRKRTVALANGSLRLGTRRVVETDETVESEVLLDLLAVGVIGGARPGL
jgi:hypothetical protein